MEEFSTDHFKGFARSRIAAQYPEELVSRIGRIALLSGAVEGRMRLLLQSLMRHLGAEGSAAIVKNMSHGQICAVASQLARSPNTRQALGDELADWIVALCKSANENGQARNKFLHGTVHQFLSGRGTPTWNFGKAFDLEGPPVDYAELDKVIEGLDELQGAVLGAIANVTLKLGNPTPDGKVFVFPEQTF